MKRLIFLGFLSILSVSAINAQNKVKGTLYKTDKWADVKGKGDWVTAMDNPTHEKVEIFVTEKYIKVTFGIKIYKYAIVSKTRFSQMKIDYNVTLNGQPFLLSISEMPDKSKAINIDDIWTVSEITNVTEVELSE